MGFMGEKYSFVAQEWRKPIEKLSIEIRITRQREPISRLMPKRVDKVDAFPGDVLCRPLKGKSQTAREIGIDTNILQ
jgi:hypothetical protein